MQAICAPVRRAIQVCFVVPVDCHQLTCPETSTFTLSQTARRKCRQPSTENLLNEGEQELPHSEPYAWQKADRIVHGKMEFQM
jgi:hypothetical protein